MEQLDLDQNATRENFKKILEERDHLGRQVETSRAEADVQRRKAEENRAELAEEHAKQAEDERKQRKRVEEAERRARVAEGERDQARANSVDYKRWTGQVQSSTPTTVPCLRLLDIATQLPF
jgi:tRNA(Ile)-lysidine synthase TilS/MesJ